MDPQQQMMAAALMGGQNSMQPSAMVNYQQQMPDMMNAMQPSQTQQQPDPSQFSPQMTGYGQQNMQSPGMFGQPQNAPYGATSQMNMQPPNMMGYQ